jgi:enoyl-CoA hydratase
MSHDIVVERDGRVLSITINRPNARNAINPEATLALEAALDELEGDDTLWVGVLGADVAAMERPVFCSGADLKAVQAGRAKELWTARGGFAGVTFRERTKPLVVAVDGAALAGGLEIVLAADVVVASDRSTFGLPEVRRNLVAVGGGVWRLAKSIGHHAALQLVLTGEPINAERAFGLGLVGRLVDGDVGAAAREMAEQIATAGPLAVQASLRLARAADTVDEAALRVAADEVGRALLRSKDTREGIAAFLERRPPEWTAT